MVSVVAVGAFVRGLREIPSEVMGNQEIPHGTRCSAGGGGGHPWSPLFWYVALVP